MCALSPPSRSDRATIADVAKLAGVAPSSVSRVFSDHPNVSQGLRHRVLEASEMLSYEPNPMAASLRSQRTRTIGTVVRDLSSPLYARILNTAQDALQERSYSMLVANSRGSNDLGVRHIRKFARRRVDGLILSLESDSEDSLARVFEHTSGPIVLLDRDVPEDVLGSDVAAIQCDHYTGCRSALDMILSRGHERIAYLGSRPINRPWRQRLQAYRDALADANVGEERGLIQTVTRTVSEWCGEVHRLLALPQPPTAIFAAGVEIASGALLALAKEPEAVRARTPIVACDKIDLMDLSTSPLVVVDRDRDLIGKLAATQLLAMIEDSAVGSIQTIPTRAMASYLPIPRP